MGNIAYIEIYPYPLHNCRDVSNRAVTNSARLSGLPRSFNPKAKTYFIIHGWNGGNVEGWVKKMIDALLKKV